MSDDTAPRAPAERLAHAARAAQELSQALWEALREELREPEAERVAALSQRLTDVVASVALLAEQGVASGTEPTPLPHEEGPPRRPAASAPPESLQEAASAPRAPTSAPGLLIDEYEGASPIEPVEPAAASIEIHDARAGEEARADGDTWAGQDAPAAGEWSGRPAAWIDSIGGQLERYVEDGRPFAVLLVEPIDIDRLAQAEPARELGRLLAEVERALGRELRPSDVLTREARGRWWLISAGADGIGARVLAERLARAVRLAVSHRGVGLELAIGIAVCPEDGREAAALAAHADIGVYAARAAGRPVAPVDPPAA